MKKLFTILLLLTSLVLFSNTVTAQSSQSGVKKIRPTLNHVALYVVDLKKSTHFYQYILELDSIADPFHDERHTWFSIGPLSHLHLIQGAKEFSLHPKNSHLCFTVPSVQDFIKILDAHQIAYENLAGEKMQVTKRVDGVFQIYFNDPDGYWIEINDAKY